jgi:Na+-driven multidrug efflux pump
VSFKFRDFKFNKEILTDIFNVGLPASFQQLSMSITMILVNIIIVNVAQAGDDGVAVYSAGWRVVQMAILPMLGLATAIITVTGATYGAKEFKKLDTTFIYSIKIGLIIEVSIALFTFIFAPFLTAIFTTGEGSANIVPDLEMFLQIVCLFYPGAALGIAASSLFQGTGKGLYSLITTLLRTVVLTPILAVVIFYVFNTGLVGIWWAIVIANLIGSMVSYTWAKKYVNNLIKYKIKNQI